MADERLGLAIERLERALARAEALADRPAAAEDGPSPDDFADLERRHSALRRQTISAVAELDAVIAHAEAGARG
jgi:hypothetical protein